MVYFDMSIVNSHAPEDVHQAKLRRLIDAGFGDRIMFGSDTRPAGPILRRLENIGWLAARSAVPSFMTTPHAFCVSTLRRSRDITAAETQRRRMQGADPNMSALCGRLTELIDRCSWCLRRP